MELGTKEVAAAMTLDKLRQNSRTEILRLAREHGALNVRVFGSIARGTATESSDLDLLVDFSPERSLLDQIALQQDLEQLLGCHVDLLEPGGVSPHLAKAILSEAIPL
jgi:predicted nucleotidyltransferase